jgi:hypothetical protein
MTIIAETYIKLLFEKDSALFEGSLTGRIAFI